MENILITGGAGFIGSHLVDRLAKNKFEITVIDNLKSGSLKNIENHIKNNRIEFIHSDIIEDEIENYFKNIDTVFHLSANSRVNGQVGFKSFYNQNVKATINVLEAMKKNNVKTIIFPSTSTVYGEAETIPTKESSTLNPISLYGQTKLICEIILSSYSIEFDFRSIICRLANIVGPRGHGVINDFVDKLRKNKKELFILGDGKQNKSYLYIDDLIESFLLLEKKSKDNLGIYNIGSVDQIHVLDIAKIISEEMNIKPIFNVEKTDRGWVGDVPKMLLSIDKIKNMGWNPKTNSTESVRKTVRNILNY